MSSKFHEVLEIPRSYEIVQTNPVLIESPKDQNVEAQSSIGSIMDNRITILEDELMMTRIFGLEDSDSDITYLLDYVPIDID
uniref:Uncharacterized protein n=1 Tax=Acrobeloides nanus TaxID=290746 RepID=A0A914EAC8_9BILA